MPFTTISPVSGGSLLPSGVTPVGGIVLDLIGASGVRVVSQVAASDLYVGFYAQSPGLIGTQSGFTPAAIAALGGGIAEAAVRFTIDDGDTAPGNFDDHHNTLLINGIGFGDFSDVETVETDGLGTVTGAPGTGFPNNRLATGFFHLTDPGALAALFESLFEGVVTFALTDTNPDDNYFDFTQGIDGGLVDVGQTPNVSPVMDELRLPAEILEGSTFAVRVTARDPDETAGGLTYRFDIDGDGVFDEENATGVARFKLADDFIGAALVEVEDARGGLTRQSIDLTVHNVAPTVVLDRVAAIAAGGTAKLTGTISDPGVADSFVVSVDWGDGTVEQHEIAAASSASQTFALTHTYTGGGESASYPLTVSVVDDDGGATVAETAIAVEAGEPPTITLAPLATTKEGNALVLTGTVTGMDGVELFKVEVDWGDGNVERVTVRREDEGAFSVSHIFAEDDQADAAREDYAVSATVISPGVRVSDAGTVTVRNVAPVLNFDPIVPVVVGGVLTLSGQLVDPGTGDTFTIDVSWGDDTRALLTLDASPDGRQRFSLEHRFQATTPTDDIPLVISVRDDDGAVRTYSRSAAVVADPPQITLSKPAAIHENGVATLTATIATVADDGPFAVSVMWGDGAAETLMFDPLARETDTFSLSHRYLDDKAIGPDRFAITVSAEGSHGAGSSATAAVGVANIAPTLKLAPIEAFGQNGVAILTGTVIDPGRSDTFTVRIDWGEVGSANRFETVTLGASASGSQTFARRHVYDDASSARYNVVATVVDDDGASGRATRVVEAQNTAPTLTLGNVGARYEGGVATLIGTIADPDPAGVQTLSINWGDGRPNSLQTVYLDVGPGGARQFSLSHRYLDDPRFQAPDWHHITATVRDGAGAFDTEHAAVHIVNTAPVLVGALQSNVAAGETVAAGALVSVSGQFRDAGVLDTHNVQINWGDGDIVWSAASPGRFTRFVDNGGSGQFAAGHRYDTGGIHTVTVVVHDDDGGHSLNTRRVAVEGVGLGAGGVIDIIAGDEAVLVNVFGDTAPRGRLLSSDATVNNAVAPGASPFVTVTTDIAGGFSQSAANSAVRAVNFVGSEFADTIDIAPTALVAATIRGFGGADRLYGGVRGDSILGDAGGDVIFGRQGLDTLSGGSGNDRIYGDFDNIKFGAFADLMRGGDGNDTMLGGGGNDTLTGEAGNDVLAGGAENDLVMGGAGADVMFGDADTFARTQGNRLPDATATRLDGSDWLVGADGNDRIYGQNGLDTLNGGNGADTLDGGNGNDLIRTGAGADTIVFRAGDDADRVFDFGAGDRIDLRELGRAYINTVADVLARTVAEGSDTVVHLGFGDTIRLQDVDRGEISADDFLV